MIRAEGVWYRVGHQVVLAGVSLHVRPGEVVGLVGPNGAGKSTLIRILALLLRPEAGCVRIEGRDAREDGAELRRRLGVVLHESLLYTTLTVAENLEFYGRLYGLGRAQTLRRAAVLLERVGLQPHTHLQVARLSHGMRQRLTLARALLHDPPVLLLDEPFTGLDAEGAGVLRGLLREHRDRGGAALVVTHDPSELEGLACRWLTLREGRLAEGPAGWALRALAGEGSR
ncbi:heme ABC exporter ATP-binding protein CcmA [Caldinitratiruptor microaerophilus]|uniref:ABC transporter domain-containing protein n=1 Tax=Caldinitratiruptor microaerophilus TaxID=671077 RepID=A0AA35G966_9FIRM|nr:heme ABC exporter ATP-binding protein CcmA [Caldinitratiruptor microaerophilus]BDG61128.1 hypothetical protein caldi_22180 [Caldinitratiruptor microaerophilus]